MKKQKKQTVKVMTICGGSKLEMHHIGKMPTRGCAHVSVHDYYTQLRQLDDNDTDNAIRTLRRIKAQ